MVDSRGSCLTRVSVEGRLKPGLYLGGLPPELIRGDVVIRRGDEILREGKEEEEEEVLDRDDVVANNSRYCRSNLDAHCCHSCIVVGIAGRAYILDKSGWLRPSLKAWIRASLLYKVRSLY